MKTRVQYTSMIAYRGVDKLSARQIVYDAILKMQYCTNNMIAHFLGWEINRVTPRCHELRVKGLVVYSHTSWCPIKKTKCHYWRVK